MRSCSPRDYIKADIARNQRRWNRCRRHHTYSLTHSVNHHARPLLWRIAKIRNQFRTNQRPHMRSDAQNPGERRQGRQKRVAAKPQHSPQLKLSYLPTIRPSVPWPPLCTVASLCRRNWSPVRWVCPAYSHVYYMCACVFVGPTARRVYSHPHYLLSIVCDDADDNHIAYTI